MTPSITIAASEPGPTALGPRRFALARRHKFGTSVCALVTLALLLRLVWGWQSGRQVAAAMEDLRRRGQPVAPDEFNEPTLGSDENAWPVYVKAIVGLKPNVD